MLDFLYRLVKAVWCNSVGAIARACSNAWNAKVDKEDHRTIGRFVTYTGFIMLLIFFPAAAALIALFRMLVVLDIIGMIASILQDTANSYA